MHSQQSILIINYEYPPLGGGGGHASSQIATRLVQKGYDVHVLTSRYRGQLKDEEIDGVKIHRIWTLRRHLEKCSVFEMIVFMIMGGILGLDYANQIKPNKVLSFFSIPSGPVAWLIKVFHKVPYTIALRLSLIHI